MKTENDGGGLSKNSFFLSFFLFSPSFNLIMFFIIHRNKKNLSFKLDFVIYEWTKLEQNYIWIYWKMKMAYTKFFQFFLNKNQRLNNFQVVILMLNFTFFIYFDLEICFCKTSKKLYKNVCMYVESNISSLK